jgi:hypothetical protein
MRLCRFILLAWVAILFSSYIALDIYSKQMKDRLVDNILIGYSPYCGYDSIIRPIHLYNFLAGNLTIQEPDGPESDDWMWNQDGTIMYPTYKKIWRDVVAKNPALLFTAWDAYGEEAILELNSKLGYYAKNPTENYEQYTLFNFNTIDFWKCQKKHHIRYNNLMDALLKLDDKKLHFFINSADLYDDALSFDFTSWLLKEGLIDQSHKSVYYPNEPEKANNCYMYPGDLILLTKRICLDYPEWTPRQFLTECKRFNTNVLTTIQSIYP